MIALLFACLSGMIKKNWPSIKALQDRNFRIRAGSSCDGTLGDTSLEVCLEMNE